MVPPSLKAEIWRTYVPGQEIRKDPTREYLEVQHRCVEYVATREGRREKPAQRELFKR